MGWSGIEKRGFSLLKFYLGCELWPVSLSGPRRGSRVEPFFRATWREPAVYRLGWGPRLLQR